MSSLCAAVGQRHHSILSFVVFCFVLFHFLGFCLFHWTHFYWAPTYSRLWPRRWWYSRRQNWQKSLPFQSIWSLHSSEIKTGKLIHGENDHVVRQRTIPWGVTEGIPYCLSQKKTMTSLQGHPKRQGPDGLPNALRKPELRLPLSTVLGRRSRHSAPQGGHKGI